MHVFERLLFYASPIYLSFIQPLWGRWGDSRAHRQLALRKRHVNLLWELSNTVCQFMRAVPAWRSWENKVLDALTFLAWLEGAVSYFQTQCTWLCLCSPLLPFQMTEPRKLMSSGSQAFAGAQVSLEGRFVHWLSMACLYKNRSCA